MRERDAGQSGPLASPRDQGSAACAAIDAMRQRGADRFDPVRFRFIEALARRAAAHRGAARRILDGKLAKALTEYDERFAQAQGRAEDTSDRLASGARRTPLADLVGHIAQHLPDDPEACARATAGAPVELKSVRYFRNTWAKLSVEHQLAQALAQGPKNAGPLNSHLLALQSLKLMRDVSPDYLNRFMSYVDALLWLDQADSRSPAMHNAVRGESDRKRKTARVKSG